MAQILVVNEQADDRDVVCAELRAAGHDTFSAATGREGLDVLRRTSPSLVITNSGLPDMDGLEFVAGVRGSNGAGSAPVLMLAANAEADSVARARAAGVDEIVFRPWQPEELIARVNAALHRPDARGVRELLAHAGVELDRLSHKVLVQGTQVDLAPIEFRLLAYLMEHPGRVLDRQQLLEDVWNRREGIGERTVDVHVRRLRATFEPFGCEDLIQTVRGFGYRFG